jgi:hypothetical protein
MGRDAIATATIVSVVGAIGLVVENDRSGCCEAVSLFRTLGAVEMLNLLWARVKLSTAGEEITATDSAMHNIACLHLVLTEPMSAISIV